MSVEKPDWSGKKGWARGEDAEAALGKEEVESIRTRASQERARKVFSQENPRLSAIFADFFEVVTEYGELSEDFYLSMHGDIRGGARRVKKKGGTPPSRSLPGLFEAGVILKSNKVSDQGRSTNVEDIRLAALKCTELYPELFFEFKEDRQKNSFSYSVSIRRES